MEKPSVKPSAARAKEPIKEGPGGDQPDSQLRLWKTHRQDSVFFQREAQVNFWTVLGGLCMGALLTQLSPLLVEIQNSRWYLVLFLISSILIVANSWVQTAWGSLVMKWPISITSTVIVLFQMFIQSLQCLLITNPAGWMAATGGLIFFALLLQVYFQRSGSWEVLPTERIKQVKINNTVYISFLVLCFSAALQMSFLPSRISEMIWGFVVLILTLLALYMQHTTMQEEKKILEIP